MRKRISRICDFGGSLPPQIVDAHLRTRAGELVDRVFKLFRIVRNLAICSAGENVRKCRPSGLYCDLCFVSNVNVTLIASISRVTLSDVDP